MGSPPKPDSQMSLQTMWIAKTCLCYYFVLVFRKLSGERLLLLSAYENRQGTLSSVARLIL